MMDKAAFLAKLVLIERTEESDLFGPLQLRELTRATFRAIAQHAATGDDKIDIDKWNGGIFAAGVVENGAPAFTLDEILIWPHRDELWDEIRRVASAILSLSEVGPEHLKAPSSDSPDP